MTRDLFEEYGIKGHKPVSGWKGIAHEAYETIANPLSHPIQSLMETLPGLISETYGLGKQAVNLPFETIEAARAPIEELPNKIPRLTKNLAQGFENFVNTPANIAGYLGKHGIGFPADIAERAHIKVNPFEMGEQQQGDIFAQALPSVAMLGPYGELGELSNVGRAASRAGAGAGMGVTQNQNPIQTALLNAAIPAAVEKFPGFTNKAIAKQISTDRKIAIQKAAEQYDQFFNKAKEHGVHEIERPSINLGNIIRNTIPDYHRALERFYENPSLENAHWAQSDLGFAERHLKKIHEKTGLSSTKQQTLKDVIEARNRIKKEMFDHEKMKKAPEMEDTYNQLSQDYAENVVPYRQLMPLNKYEAKKLTANNMIKELLANDEFKLGLGKKYPQIQINRALRSPVAKLLGGTALSGIGFEEGRKLIR